MPSDVDLLRTDLEAAEFTVDSLTTLWGADAAAALHRGQRVPAMRALGHDPLSTIARLFVLGMPANEKDVARAFPSAGIDGLVDLELARIDGDVLHPLRDLRPYSFVDATGVGSWWIASDLGEVAIGGPLPEDHVLGVGGASVTLSGLMTQRPVLSALDLGTGCGIQAMHASRHARRVIATDISERALAIARFNAGLNRIENIEFRHGSLFEPVAGERFDHIVCNPPFVITPRSPDVPAYEYRDGGMSGDELVRSVIAGCAEHLADGGMAQLLGNWEYRGIDGLARVEQWCAQSGLDAWVIEREVQDVALYAETWIRDGGTRPGVMFDALYAAWLDDFASRGTSSVGFGYIALRRTGSATPLRRFERLTGALGHSATGLGQTIAGTFDAHDRLGEVDLGRERLRLAADVTEERSYWPGAEDPTVITIRQGGGFGRSVQVGTALAGFVGACDGDLTVDAIIGALADLLGADAAALDAELRPRIRELVLTGILA